MAFTQQDIAALEDFSQAFRNCPRPVHFTNFEHCDECAEHDRLLLSRTPETLSIENVDNPGWDPICFISPDGFAYFLPALVRLVLEESASDAEWFGNQFFWHLISDGPGNARLRHCSQVQRDAVARFISYLIETRSDQIEANCANEDALRALEIWSESQEVRPV